MFQFCRFAFLLLVFVAPGCSEASTSNPSPDAAVDASTDSGSTDVALCQIGTVGCGCSAAFPCTDAGYFCVNEVCVECPVGSEGCGCDTGNTCDAGLECTNPDPECMSFNCAPWSCEAAACGPTQLCDKTINECSEPLTQDACEAFYADSSNCSDMDAYTTCNCVCLEQASCSAYLACGNNCFNDHCN